MKNTERLVRAAVSSNVRRLRIARGLSQEALAERTGLHRTYIGAVERREKNLTVRSLAALADGLHVTASSLLAYEKANRD